jgi:DsbC/DsbD-like thiol-disulfide interchange protein
MRLLAAALLCSLPALARAADPVPPQPVAEVGLVAGWQEADGTQVAALDIRLAPGWHTYWRVPGMNGIPPVFDWSASRNLEAVGYEWPRPIVFDSFGSPTIGYKGALTLPLRLTPADPAQPVEIDLDLFFGVCKDICVPAEARVLAVLDPAAPEPPAEGRARIEAALAARPLPAAEGGVTAARCVLGSGAEGPRVEAEITFRHAPGAAAILVIEAPGRPEIWIGEAAARSSGNRLLASARIDGGGGPLALDRDGLRLTVIDGAHAVDIRGCASGP